MLFGFVGLVASLALLGWWSLRSLAQIAVNGPVYQRIVSGLQLKADLLPPTLFIVESHLACLDLAATQDSNEQDRIIARLSVLRSEYYRAHIYWSGKQLDARIAHLLLDHSYQSALHFYEVAYRDLIPAARAHRLAAVAAQMRILKHHFEEHRRFVDQAALISTEMEHGDKKWSALRIHAVAVDMASAVALAALFILILGVLVHSTIVRPLHHALGIAQQISAGNFDVGEPEHFSDEPGQLLSALTTMCASLRAMIAQLERANHINDQAMDVSKAGTWTMDLRDASLVSCLSARAQAILGEPARADNRYDWQYLEGNRVASGEVLAAAALEPALLALRHGQAAELDVVYAYRRPLDGQVIWVHSAGRVEYDAQGRPAQVYGMIIDVTAAKRTEAALQRAHLLSRTAFEMAKAGAWQIDVLNCPQRRQLSGDAARLYGLSDSATQLSDAVWHGRTSGVDILSGLAPRAVFAQALRQRVASYEAVYAFRRPLDEVVVWLHDRGLLRYNDAGDAVEITGVVMDVTQTQHIQEALRRSNGVLEQALHLARAATWSKNCLQAFDGICLSERAMRLLGFYPRANGLVALDEWQQQIARASDADKAAAVLQQLQAVLQGSSQRIDTRYPLARQVDGAVMWIQDIADAVLDGEGQLVAIHGVLRDVTRERQAEEAILAAMEEAEAASRAKGDFLANMSHEIRTPMNAIIGLSGLALKHEMPQRIQDYLLKIRNSGEHLLGIINDILDFSKIESGKVELEAIPFELNSVLDKVVNLLGDKVQGKGLEMVCSMAPELPRVLIGDPLRIGQIFINYVSNAIKFTETGEVRLGVALEEADADSVLIRFTVADTGIGMTEVQMERLFKSFEQGDTSITRQYGGTGLGLAICKRLAMLMGGNVGVESVYGAGSTFWFSARLGIGSREKRVSRLDIGLYGRKVLVVDDNAAAATVLSANLVELGFMVQSVGGGVAALQLLQQAAAAGTPFDLLLIDWVMPGMDGLETVRQLQALPLAPAPLVLLLSAHRPGELLAQAEQVGVRYVLSKPVNSSELIDTLMQMLGLEQPGARLPDTPRRSSKELELQALAGARILLVEDNDINQQVACELLRGVGMDIEVADNGQRALQSVAASFAQHLGFDLVLMDIQMPVLDGISATRLLRETYSSQALPVVAMTANVMQADRERCLEAGMNGFVSKPINPEDLWSVLLQWIRPRPGLGPVAPASVPALAPPAAGTLAPVEAKQRALQRLAPLRQCAVLDLDYGLRLTSSNPLLYLQLLQRFLATQADASQAIAAALERGERGTAERLAHTLKGVCGTLGERAVAQCADQLEHHLRFGGPAPELQAAQEALQTRLCALVAALQALPGLLPLAPLAPAAAAVLDEAQRAAALRLLQSLRQLLQDDDAQAQALWQAQSELLWPLLPQPEALAAAINEFEFARALHLLPPDEEAPARG